MQKKSGGFLVWVLAATLLMAGICYGNEMVSGVVKSFDAKTGSLVMQTATQKEAAFSIPQTIKVYFRVKGKDLEVTDSWQFLKDNLMKGTKLDLMEVSGTVITIWIVRIPQ
jgi:hypothetical protein